MYHDLPWEVIERVIDHSADDLATLRSFSLTCRDLRPRSLSCMVASARIATRNQIFDFCAFLQEKPHLKQLVRSITAPLNHFSPCPLLHILPNVSEIKFYFQPCHHDKKESKDDYIYTSSCKHVALTGRVFLNPSILESCRQFGNQIQKLHLYKLSFPTGPELLRLLLAFTCLTNLVCEDVTIDATGEGPNGARLEAVLTRRVSERLRLKELAIYWDALSMEPRPATESVISLLLDDSLAESTIETVTLPLEAMDAQRALRLYACPQFQSLIMMILDTGTKHSSTEIYITAACLKDLHGHHKLEKVVIQLSFYPYKLSGDTNARPYTELEQAMLKVSKPRLECVTRTLHVGRVSLWTRGLAKLFPALYGRGALRAWFGSPIRNVDAFLMAHERCLNARRALVASSDKK